MPPISGRFFDNSAGAYHVTFPLNAILSLVQETPAAAGGEANLILPDLSSVTMLGMNGRSLLMLGLLVCAAGLAFGIMGSRSETLCEPGCSSR